MDESRPFQVELDLTGTRTGDAVAIVVRGAVGLESDPGEFSAIPIASDRDWGSGAGSCPLRSKIRARTRMRTPTTGGRGGT